VKVYVWSIELCGAERWILCRLDQVCLEIFLMWCWRMIEIGWTNYMRNEEVLHSVKEERHMLHTVNQRKANWIRHI
jgi:hypothetical protein